MRILFPVKSIIIIVSFLFVAPVVAQNSNVQLLNTTSGLPLYNVHSIVQDNKGYMWFGTHNGLVRFDGYDYLLITRDIAKLTSDKITYLEYDKRKNELWIATEKGLNILNLYNYTVTDFDNFFEEKKNTDNLPDITCIYQSLNGTMWVGTRNGIIYKFNSSYSLVKVQPRNMADSKIKLGGIQSIAEDFTGHLWIGSEDNNCYKIDTSTGRIRSTYKINEEGLQDITINNNLAIYALSIGGISKYDPVKNCFTKIFPEIDNILEGLIDHKGELWMIKRPANLISIKPDGHVSYHGEELSDIYQSVFRLYCLYEDRSQNIWIGTDYGIIKIRNTPSYFQPYLSYRNRNNSAINSMRGIAEDEKHNLYFAGYNGLFKYDHAEDKTIPITMGNKPLDFVPYALLHDSANNAIWVTSEGAGLVKYDIKKSRIIKYSIWNPPNDSNRIKYIISITRDHDGLLWLGGYDSIMIFNPSTENLSSYHALFAGYQVGNLRVYNFCLTKDNHMWLATNEGVFELGNDRKPIRHIDDRRKRGYALSNKNIRHIYEDKNGLMWFGTMGGGLNSLNRETGKIEVFNMLNGLSDNIINAILADNKNNLWISTNNGVSTFNLRTKNFRNFYAEDGLTHNEFNHSSYLKSTGGKLYFGGLNGVNEIDVNNIEFDNVSLPLFITDVDIHHPAPNTDYTPLRNIDSIRQIILPYDNRYVSFKFALADYCKTIKNIYAYKLVGLDEKWNYIGNQNSIRFASLPPGNYTLKIKAAGSNGIWNPQQISLPITVKQSVYLTWWFISLVSALILLIAFGIYSYRISEIKKMADMRIKIASDLHDDVGSILTRVAMQAELVKRSVDPSQKNSLERISETCRSAISNMRDVIWSIDARNDSMVSFIDRMHEHALQMLEPAGFNYNIQVDKYNLENKITVTDRQAFFLIYKEALNNIVKHSNGNFVEICFKRINNMIVLTVHDNGIFDNKENYQYSGSGLRNMKMRAQKANAKLKINIVNGFEISVSKKL